MATFNLEVPEEIARKLREGAAEAGQASVEAYSQALLLADVEPAAADEQLEHLLLERLDAPDEDIEATPEFVDSLGRRDRKRPG